MLTPVFYCEQNDSFVVVRLILSGICKIANALFDINEYQFTFHCSPYYLRLRFDQRLEEDKGERATYDLESNTLTVWLPKQVNKETFTQLDNPAYLIATEKERKQLVTVLNSVDGVDSERLEAGTVGDDRAGVEEAEETEYIQTLRRASSLGPAEAPSIRYGFADHFSGLFNDLDVDMMREIVALPAPEITLPQERRRLRLERENDDFDPDALLFDFEDESGEVARLLKYLPRHVRDFQTALQDGDIASKQGALCITGLAPPTADTHEDDDEAITGTGCFEVWSGNVEQFRRPDGCADEEAGARVAVPMASGLSSAAPNPMSLPLQAQAPPSLAKASSYSAQLAVPRQKPVLCFTKEEQDSIIRIKPPRLLFPPSFSSVAALTADLLFAEAYDDLVTEGTGCSESLWNLCTLSPALCFLDPAEDVYGACVSFARRALIYPLHRHFELVLRVFAVAGKRLLLGRMYVIQALLRVRDILIHAEHKHILSRVFVEPLIGYWMNMNGANERLEAIALEIHAHVTRTEPVEIRMGGRSNYRDGLPLSNLLQGGKKVLYPLTLLNLGLPLQE